VGGFAVRLAHARGAEVIATASTANVQVAAELGTNQVIDHPSERFEDLVEPVDLVFDTAGAERLERSPAVLRKGGRLVSIAEEPPAATGGETEAVYFVVKSNRDQLGELARLVDVGRLRPTIDKTFPLTEAREAFARSLAGDRSGRLVLTQSATRSTAGSAQRNR
jgi:NADPH:quinone reductase-like Zn-dependent oxidoreductase